MELLNKGKMVKCNNEEEAKKIIKIRLERALQEIKEGRTIGAEEAFKELHRQFNFWWNRILQGKDYRLYIFQIYITAKWTIYF